MCSPSQRHVLVLHPNPESLPSDPGLRILSTKDINEYIATIDTMTDAAYRGAHGQSGKSAYSFECSV